MELLFLGAAVLGAAAVAGIAGWNVYQKVEAQRELVLLLAQNTAGPVLVPETNPLAGAELAAYVDFIEGKLESMEEAHKKQILQGLRQSSRQGQAAYVGRLLKKADAARRAATGDG